jgi:hypothetical protein
MPNESWSLLIDIEGFGSLWEREDRVLWALGHLLEGIVLVGRNFYPREPDRLFAHQIGDGVLIKSDFHEESLERAVAIAISLLRHVAASGRFASAVLTEGEMSDIQGRYPKVVRDALEADHTVSLRMGLLTLFPVMGTALIRAVRLSENSPSGSLLLVNAALRARLPSGLMLQDVTEQSVVSIDWVHSELPLVQKIQAGAGLRSPSPSQLERAFRAYFDEQHPPLSWRANTALLLQLPSEEVNGRADG